MDGLSETLQTVAGRVRQYRTKAIGEQNTKQGLILPVLRSLGWDTEDLEEVRLEYKPKPSHNPVDYALLIMRAPRLFVEAKGLGENLLDHRWAGQIMGYAAVAGVKWVVLTDGDIYRIYNAHAPVPVEDKLFRSVRISDEPEVAGRTLLLLSKEQLADNEIDALWKIHFVDREVRQSLERLFSAQVDSLVKLLRKQSSLFPSEIKASLARLRIHLDFPAEASTVEPAAKVVTRAQPKLTLVSPTTKAPGTPRTTKGAGTPWRSVTLDALAGAGLISPGATVEVTYKGKRYQAVLEEGGRLRWDGQTYESLSAAAQALSRSVTPERHSVNGWTFWHVRDPSGNPVVIDELRKRFFRGSAVV